MPPKKRNIEQILEDEIHQKISAITGLPSACKLCKKKFKNRYDPTTSHHGRICRKCYDTLKYCYICHSELESRYVKNAYSYIKTHYGPVCRFCFYCSSCKKTFHRVRDLIRTKDGLLCRTCFDKMDQSIYTFECYFCEKKFKRAGELIKTKHGELCRTCYENMKYCIRCKKELNLEASNEYTATPRGLICMKCFHEYKARKHKKQIDKEKITERRKNLGGRPRKKIDKQKLLQLRKEGKPMREIGKELDISHTSVIRELNKLKEQQEFSK